MAWQSYIVNCYIVALHVKRSNQCLYSRIDEADQEDRPKHGEGTKRDTNRTIKYSNMLTPLYPHKYSERYWNMMSKAYGYTNPRAPIGWFIVHVLALGIRKQISSLFL